MSDPLKDAMSRAVDRIAPFPPNADALKKAAKRSQLRRRIVGGWIGFIILSSLSGWLFFDSQSDEGRPRPDRNQIAAPATWDNPGVSGRIQLPTSALELIGTENDLWAALDGGTLLRVNSQTRGITGTFEVGRGVEKVAANDGRLWLGHITEETFDDPPIIPGGVYDTISEFDPVTNESRVVAEFGFTRGPIVVESGNVFFIAKTDGSNTGGLKMLSPDGQTKEFGLSTGSLTAADGSVWAVFSHDQIIELDAGTGEILRWVETNPSSAEQGATCYVCPSLGKEAIAANDDFLVHLPDHAQRLDVFDRTGNFLYEVNGLNHGLRVAIEGSHAFVGLRGERIAIVDLESGRVVEEVDTGVTAGPMAVSNGSVWIADLNGEEIVEVSDLGPAPDSSIASAPPEDETLETYRDEELGFEVTYPSDWNRAEEPMTKLVDPREILTLGTMSLDIDDTELGDCGPVEPLSRLGPHGALISILERENAEPGPYPLGQWPSDFGLDDLRGPEFIECWDPREIQRGFFLVSGRAIYIYVALGDDAGPERRQEVSRTLGSLRFEPLDSD